MHETLKYVPCQKDDIKKQNNPKYNTTFGETQDKTLSLLNLLELKQGKRRLNEALCDGFW